MLLFSKSSIHLQHGESEENYTLAIKQSQNRMESVVEAIIFNRSIIMLRSILRNDYKPRIKPVGQIRHLNHNRS